MSRQPTNEELGAPMTYVASGMVRVGELVFTTQELIVAFQAEREALRSDLAEARDLLGTSEALKEFHETNETELRKALKLIANHPHNSYDSFEGHAPHIDRQYEIGASDGHRCAAQIARDALEPK